MIDVALYATVWLAGTNDHMILTPRHTLSYVAEPRDYPYRPSIDVFFKSLIKNGPAHWPSMVGLGVITLATVVNFALAGMEQQELDAMPAVLKVPYDMGGRLGVKERRSPMQKPVVASDVTSLPPSDAIN